MDTDCEIDLSVTDRQLRKLFHLGYSIKKERVQFLSRGTARIIIRQLELEQAGEATRRRAERKRREQARSSRELWQFLNRMEETLIQQIFNEGSGSIP